MARSKTKRNQNQSKPNITWKANQGSQKQLCNALKDHTHDVLALGVAGSGKAQPNSEPVLTPNGWVTVGDVKEGDYLVDQQGKPTQVLKTYPQGVIDTYLVEFSDGTSTRCCENHLWEVATPEMLPHGHFKVVKLKDIIKEGIKLDTEENINTSSNRFSIRVNAPVEHNHIPYQLDLYTLGCATVRCSQPPHKKHIPATYMIGSSGQRLELLRGILDSGRSDVNSKEKKVRFASESERVANDVANLVRSLGGIASVSKVDSGDYGCTGDMWNVSIRILVNPFLLSKNKELWDNCGQEFSFTKEIVNITKIGKEESTCFTVDSTDSLYLTKDYIVTHNTYVAINSALDAFESRQINQIILARPSIGTCQGLGFDKGDSDSKMSGWVMPMLNVMMKRYGFDRGQGIVQGMIERGELILQPLHKITGMDIGDAWLVVDEVQGVNIDTMKSIVTRVNETGKIVLCGDVRQVTLKGNTGVSWLIDKIDRHNGFGFHQIEFTMDDCVRSGRVKQRLYDMAEDGEY